MHWTKNKWRHAFASSLVASNTKHANLTWFPLPVMQHSHTWHDYRWPWVTLTWLLYNMQLDVMTGHVKPWAECGSCSTLGLFLFYFYVGDQMQTSFRPNHVQDFESCNLWCLFVKSCWNTNTGKILQILVPLMCVKYIFFGFIEALDLKLILNKLRMDGMCWCCSFNFCYVTNKIVLTCKFFSLESTVVNLFWMLWVSAVGLGNWTEFSGCFIKVSSDI